MLAIMMLEGPPTSIGPRKSPRVRTKAKVAPAIRPGSERGRMTRRNVDARAGAEIVGGFDEMARDVFERSVERKEDERRVNVGEQ